MLFDISYGRYNRRYTFYDNCPIIKCPVIIIHNHRGYSVTRSPSSTIRFYIALWKWKELNVETWGQKYLEGVNTAASRPNPCRMHTCTIWLIQGAAVNFLGAKPLWTLSGYDSLACIVFDNLRKWGQLGKYWGHGPAPPRRNATSAMWMYHSAYDNS